MRVEFIKKILEFSQTDYSKATAFQKQVAVSDMEYIRKGDYFAPYSPANRPISDDEWCTVLAYQEQWENALKWFYDCLLSDWTIAFEKSFSISWSADASEGRFHVARTSDRGEMFVSANPIDNPYEAVRVLFPQGASSFFQAIDGHSSKSFLYCEHCGKMFYNPSKRKMRFCSTDCQHTAAVKRAYHLKKENEKIAN